MRRLTLRLALTLLAFIIGVILSAPVIVSWQRASGEIRAAGVEKKSREIKSVAYRGVASALAHSSPPKSRQRWEARARVRGNSM